MTPTRGLAVGDVGQDLHRVPSAVSPGPVHEASACAPPGRTRPDARPRRPRVRSRRCRPPSTRRRVPALISITPAVPTTQGMPSWRAMIAVWLVGPPRSVTSASTTRGSRVAVSEGARSSASRTPARRASDARLGLADQVGDDPALDVAEVGDPLGHQPAHLGEDRHELLDGRAHRGQQVLAAAQVLADRGAQPLVAGQAGTRGQHLGRGTRRACRLAREAVGDRLRRRRRTPRGRSPRRAPRRRSARPPRARPRRAPPARARRRRRDDRRAVQGSGVGMVLMATRYPRTPLTSQHIRA